MVVHGSVRIVPAHRPPELSESMGGFGPTLWNAAFVRLSPTRLSIAPLTKQHRKTMIGIPLALCLETQKCV